MSGHVCLECLESACDSLDGLCARCRDALRLREAFDRGWRGGWAACLAFHGLVGGEAARG